MSRGTPRLTFRVSDTLRQRLDAEAARRGCTTSALVRQTLERLGEPPGPQPAPVAQPPHTLEDCVAALLQQWPAPVQQKIAAAAETTGFPSGMVVSHILSVALTQEQDTPAHPPEACASTMLTHCPPAVQARLRQVQERTGKNLLDLLPQLLAYWANTTRPPQAWQTERKRPPQCQAGDRSG